eukprot:g265.t1
MDDLHCYGGRRVEDDFVYYVKEKHASANADDQHVTFVGEQGPSSSSRSSAAGHQSLDHSALSLSSSSSSSSSSSTSLDDQEFVVDISPTTQKWFDEANNYSIEGAIFEICDNSIRAMQKEAEPKIWIQYKGNVETPYLEIWDNGYGMHTRILELYGKRGAHMPSHENFSPVSYGEYVNWDQISKYGTGGVSCLFRLGSVITVKTKQKGSTHLSEAVIDKKYLEEEGYKMVVRKATIKSRDSLRNMLPREDFCGKHARKLLTKSSFTVIRIEGLLEDVKDRFGSLQELNSMRRKIAEVYVKFISPQMDKHVKIYVNAEAALGFVNNQFRYGDLHEFFQPSTVNQRGTRVCAPPRNLRLNGEKFATYEFKLLCAIKHSSDESSSDESKSGELLLRATYLPKRINSDSEHDSRDTQEQSQKSHIYVYVAGRLLIEETGVKCNLTTFDEARKAKDQNGYPEKYLYERLHVEIFLDGGGFWQSRTDKSKLMTGHVLTLLSGIPHNGRSNSRTTFEQMAGKRALGRIRSEDNHRGLALPTELKGLEITEVAGNAKIDHLKDRIRSGRKWTDQDSFTAWLQKAHKTLDQELILEDFMGTSEEMTFGNNEPMMSSFKSFRYLDEVFTRGSVIKFLRKRNGEKDETMFEIRDIYAAAETSGVPSFVFLKGKQLVEDHNKKTYVVDKDVDTEYLLMETEYDDDDPHAKLTKTAKFKKLQPSDLKELYSAGISDFDIWFDRPQTTTLKGEKFVCESHSESSSSESGSHCTYVRNLSAEEAENLSKNFRLKLRILDRKGSVIQMVKKDGANRYTKPETVARFKLSCCVTFQDIGANPVDLWKHEDISFQRSTRNNALIYVVKFSEISKRIRTHKIIALSRPGTFTFTFEYKKVDVEASIAPIKKVVRVEVKARSPETFDTSWVDGDDQLFTIGGTLGPIEFLGKVGDSPGILNDKEIAALKSSLSIQYVNNDGRIVKQAIKTTKKMIKRDPDIPNRLTLSGAIIKGLQLPNATAPDGHEVSANLVVSLKNSTTELISNVCLACRLQAGMPKKIHAMRDIWHAVPDAGSTTRKAGFPKELASQGKFPELFARFRDSATNVACNSLPEPIYAVCKVEKGGLRRCDDTTNIDRSDSDEESDDESDEEETKWIYFVKNISSGGLVEISFQMEGFKIGYENESGYKAEIVVYAPTDNIPDDLMAVDWEDYEEYGFEELARTSVMKFKSSGPKLNLLSISDECDCIETQPNAYKVTACVGKEINIRIQLRTVYHEPLHTRCEWRDISSSAEIWNGILPGQGDSAASNMTLCIPSSTVADSTRKLELRVPDFGIQSTIEIVCKPGPVKKLRLLPPDEPAYGLPGDINTIFVDEVCSIFFSMLDAYGNIAGENADIFLDSLSFALKDRNGSNLEADISLSVCDDNFVEMKIKLHDESFGVKFQNIELFVNLTTEDSQILRISRRNKIVLMDMFENICKNDGDVYEVHFDLLGHPEALSLNQVKCNVDRDGGLDMSSLIVCGMDDLEMDSEFACAISVHLRSDPENPIFDPIHINVNAIAGHAEQAKVNYKNASKDVKQQEIFLDNLKQERDDIIDLLDEKKQEVDEINSNLDVNYSERPLTIEEAERIIKEFEEDTHQTFLSKIKPRRLLTSCEMSAVSDNLLSKNISEFVSADKEDVAEAISRLLPPGSNDAFIVKKTWQEAKDCGIFDALEELQEDRAVFCLYSSNSMECDNGSPQELLHFEKNDVEEEFLDGRNDYLGRAINLIYIEPFDGFTTGELQDFSELPTHWSVKTEKEEKEEAIESAEEELQRLRCVEEEWMVKLEQTSSDFSSKKKRKRQPPPHEDEDDVCIRKKAVRRF